MAAECSFIRSSKAFTTVGAFYCSTDGSGLLILPLVNGFHHVSLVLLLSGWQWIAHSSARQRLSPRFVRRAQRMAVDCSFIRLSTAFPTDCAPFCSADGSILLILPLVIGFHSLRTVLLSEWQRIAHTSVRQRLSRRFTRRIAPGMAADCSYFRSSMLSRMVCAPYCSVDGIGLLIPPLVNCFPDGLRRINQEVAVNCSYFRSSTLSKMVCTPYCSADGIGLLIPPLVNLFYDGLRAVLLR